MVYTVRQAEDSIFPGRHGEAGVWETEVETGSTQIDFRFEGQHCQGIQARHLQQQVNIN